VRRLLCSLALRLLDWLERRIPAPVAVPPPRPDRRRNPQPKATGKTDYKAMLAELRGLHEED
jgi:hypothetical protein